jgi:hypothetical protein
MKAAVCQCTSQGLSTALVLYMCVFTTVAWEVQSQRQSCTQSCGCMLHVTVQARFPCWMCAPVAGDVLQAVPCVQVKSSTLTLRATLEYTWTCCSQTSDHT